MAIAQKSSPIVTDRPDQSDGAYVLPKKLLQLENGLLFNEVGVINNFMLRYGWSRNSEIRVALDYGKITGQFSLLPVQLSIKQKLVRQLGIVPTITLIGYLNFGQLASKYVINNGTQAALLLAFHHEIDENLGIECNFGSQTFKDDLRFTFLLSYKLIENVTAFIEYYSLFDKVSDPGHNMDIGILFTINNDFHLDLGYGIESINENKSHFLTVGASHRFNTAKK